MENTGVMTDLLSAATELFTWIMSSLATVITTITANPLLLMGFLISICGLVIGFTRRLMNLT